jgi:hypothetical protein
MVDRTRVVVVAGVLLGGIALFALGSGPGTLTGTVAPNAVPEAAVTPAPASDEPGRVTVRFAGTGDWDAATLTVDWNGSLVVTEGERRLETVGESMTLSEANERGETAVRVRVTATWEGRTAVVYRRVLRI